MTVFTFGNFETEIDTADCDFMERFEAKSLQLEEKTKKVNQKGLHSEVIRQMCALAFSYFDDLFGEGTAQLLFNDKNNMRLCDAAMFALAEAVKKDKKAYNDEVSAKLTRLAGTNQKKRKKK